ncbi:nucleoside triphosphate pyrophosphohydrolase family protein [Candidatus Saccharibacteria bacterium]|nr:nucleoside triphosphate pyrophosphohydrolase family protein [Candidatus Saccharibacteria bacterium]
MKLDEYQIEARVSDLFEKTQDLRSVAFLEKLLGLTGEAGEVSDKFKKILRDKGGILSEEDRIAVAKELGDVLWYVAILSYYLEMPLSEIAQMNLNKLASRRERGVISGSGDER